MIINIFTVTYLLWAALTLGGILIHLFVDWFLQNDWMAKNKFLWVWRWNPMTGELGYPHPSGIVHAASHGVALLLLFPWWACGIVAIAHWLIDLRTPLAWWGRVFHQTAPSGMGVLAGKSPTDRAEFYRGFVDIGTNVAVWRDQVAHFVVIALVAILVI